MEETLSSTVGAKRLRQGDLQTFFFFFFFLIIHTFIYFYLIYFFSFPLNNPLTYYYYYYYSSPLGKLSLETIDEAETILFSIREALRDCAKTHIINNLSSKFYKTVPWQKEKKNIDNFEILEDLCDLLQMMRDFSIKEGGGLLIFFFFFFFYFYFILFFF